MGRLRIRFYAELSDLLPASRRMMAFDQIFRAGASVKDVIEALGVPHTEVDLLLVNGVSVCFSYTAQDGDYVSVYPRFATIDIVAVTRTRPVSLRESRFVADAHLGQLARYLRMLGFDTLYQNNYTDDQVATISECEQRTVLTRDRGLLMRNAVVHGCFIRSTNPKEQVAEVLRRFDLGDKARPFSRCLVCNETLQVVDKAQVASRLLANTQQYYDAFMSCLTCNRVYWNGSHYERMCRLIEDILAAARRPRYSG